MADLFGIEAGGLPGVFVDANYVSTLDVEAIKYYGTKPMTIFTVDFGGDASEEVGVGQAIDEVVRVIQKFCTIVIRGNLSNDEKMTFFVEIANDEIDWNNDDTATTLVDQIEADVIALGDTSGDDGWDFTGVTCTLVTDLAL